MSRPVEAVLIWLTKSLLVAEPTPASAAFGSEVSAMLRERFGSQSMKLAEWKEVEATEHNAMKSLQAAVEALKGKSEGLLVLAFSGHGARRNGDKLSWILYDREVTEDELFKAMEPLSPGIELVLICDCCYGAEILPNSTRLEPAKRVLRRRPNWAVANRRELELINRRLEALVLRLSRRAADGIPQRNVIGIAATNLLLIRPNSRDNYFATCLHQAVVSSRSATYALLDDVMKEILKEILMKISMKISKRSLKKPPGIGQESWQVVYQPAAAGALPPFRK